MKQAPSPNIIQPPKYNMFQVVYLLAETVICEFLITGIKAEYDKNKKGINEYKYYSNVFTVEKKEYEKDLFETPQEIIDLISSSINPPNS